MADRRSSIDGAADRDVPASGMGVFMLYHIARLVFGGWWLFSGLMHFLWPQIQPLGNSQPAIDFTLALMASGLFDVIKVLEVVVGLLILANRAMPAALLVLTPINVVIIYWNFVLDEGLVEWSFGALSIAFNIILAWPWRRYLWPLTAWRGEADFSTRPGNQDWRI